MTGKMPSAAELALIQTDIEAYVLPETGYILSVARVSDGQGGFTDTWGTAGTVAYRLDSIRGQEQNAAGQVSPYHTYVITLPHGTSITEANRFKSSGGTQYNVRSVDSDKSWSAGVRAYVERV